MAQVLATVKARERVPKSDKSGHWTQVLSLTSEK